MNGIKMSDCKFYVNEKERMVICVIPPYIKRDGVSWCTDRMVIDYIGENFAFSDVDMYNAIGFYESKLPKKLKMPYTFIGKAKCAPEDEWNEETGKIIAFSRAKDKCYKSFFKRANMFVQTIDKRLNDMITSFNNFGMKLEDKRVALQQNIDKRIDIISKE